MANDEMFPYNDLLHQLNMVVSMARIALNEVDTSKIRRRYWNSNGMATAIVAVPGRIGDWAAYVGSTPSAGFTEEMTVAFAYKHGAKLDATTARQLFPNMEGHYRT